MLEQAPQEAQPRAEDGGSADFAEGAYTDEQWAQIARSLDDLSPAKGLWACASVLGIEIAALPYGLFLPDVLSPGLRLAQEQEPERTDC
jgi:hypothetical protein